MSRAHPHLPWIHNGQALEEVPPGIECFVYLLTEVETGRKYIGKKSFVSVSKVEQPNGRNKHIRRESDWKKYYSSNTDIMGKVKGGNGHLFTREILWLCPNKGAASYLEAKELFGRSVLENPDAWYNQYIEVMVTGKHIAKMFGNGADAAQEDEE